MEWFASNWYIVVALLVLVVVVIIAVCKFLNLPTSKQIANLKEWLKYAVSESESMLGSGTGQLKLRLVYDMAAQKFPWVVKFVSFERFSQWVDEALKWMRHQLETNESIRNAVIGKEVE